MLGEHADLKCACCSFESPKGVLTVDNAILRVVFYCERCFSNPNTFMAAKRVLPHWTLAVHTDARKNPFAKPAPDGGDVALSGGAFSKRSKREVAMSEALYSGQRQLCSFQEVS
jgi:hypothetical protein